MGEEPSQATLAAEFPGWHFWVNPAGEPVARKLGGDGDRAIVMLYGGDWVELAAKVRAYAAGGHQ